LKGVGNRQWFSGLLHPALCFPLGVVHPFNNAGIAVKIWTWIMSLKKKKLPEEPLYEFSGGRTGL